jgi:hypothetical protein
MTDRILHCASPTAELAAAWLDHPDREVMRALVVAGAFAALAGTYPQNARLGASRTQ